MKPLKTQVDLNLGSLLHFLLGLLSVLFGGLGYTALLTFLFVVKQLLDFIEGESGSECSGDLAEFTAGIVTGLILQSFV